VICEACKKAGQLQQEAERKATVTYGIGGQQTRVPDPDWARVAREWHARCPGGTHCDCQHHEGTKVRPDHQPDPRRGA